MDGRAGTHRDGRSRAYRLKEGEDPALGIRRIAAGRLEEAIEGLRRAERGEEVADAIHGARKDLKKLRAVLRLVRERLGEDLYRNENARCREAGQLLSAARDAQVKGETLAALAGSAGLDPSLDAAIAKWKLVLAREAREASGGLEGSAGEAIAPALRLLEGARGSIEAWPLGEGSWSLVAPGISCAYRRGRAAMLRAESDRDEEAVHEWRKRAKDLWYQLRILTVLWPQAMEGAAAEAHRLADLLGDHHDLTILAADLESRGLDGGATAALRESIAARQRQLLDGALELGSRVYAERPKAFRRRVHAYWKAWDPGSSS